MKLIATGCWDVVNVISFHGFEKQLDTNMEEKSFIDYERQRNNPQVRKLHSHRLQKAGKHKCGNINAYFFLFMLLPSKQSELVIAGDKKAVSTVCGLTEYIFFYKPVEN